MLFNEKSGQEINKYFLWSDCMINILLAEDSKIQRENFISMISQLNTNINVYEADNKADALDIARSNAIDFFFVDINLVESSGLDLGLEIRRIPKYTLSWIIFISSYSNYMFEAFKQIHCYDYIIKPYDAEKVKEITQLLINNYYKKNRINTNIERRFAIFNQDGISFKIYIDEIVFLEVSIRTCTIHTSVGKYKLSRLPLKEALKTIDDPYIIKSHKSYAVNTKYIRSIEKYSLTSWNIYFDNYKETAFMGSKYKDKILNLFEQL